MELIMELIYFANNLQTAFERWVLGMMEAQKAHPDV